MGLSINKFPYAGEDEFDLNFALGYASKGDISAYKEADTPVALTFDWLTDNRVILTPGHGLVTDDVVVFRRTVSKTSLPVDLRQPGEANRINLALLSEHVMYSLHEVLDGRIADTVEVEEAVVSAVTLAVEEALAALVLEVVQFEQLYFSFYQTFDGQQETTASARDMICNIDNALVVVKVNPTDVVEFVLFNDGEAKASFIIDTDGSVTRSVTGGGTTFTLVAGETYCTLSGTLADATLKASITVIGAVDITGI